MADKIYTVTTVHFKDEKYGSSPRTVGWFPDLITAMQCVAENWGDIHETTYDYVAIEQVPSGLYPAGREEHAEYWFQWKDGGYRPCEKPEQLQGTLGVGIG